MPMPNRILIPRMLLRRLMPLHDELQRLLVMADIVLVVDVFAIIRWTALHVVGVAVGDDVFGEGLAGGFGAGIVLGCVSKGRYEG